MVTLIAGSSGSGKTSEALKIAWSKAIEGERVVIAASEYGYTYMIRELNRLVDGYNEDVASDNIRFVEVYNKLTDRDIANINDAFEHYKADVIVLDGVTDVMRPEDFEDAYDVVSTVQLSNKDYGADVIEESFKEYYGVDEVIVCGR